MIQKNVFGIIEGQDIYSYIITNKNGMYLEILSLGGIINRLVLPTKKGSLIDIALGHDSLDSFYKDYGLLGGIVGRNANRIANGSFVLNGEKIQLETGEGGHNLHSGSGCYLKKVFSVEELGGSSVLLKCLDQGEAGFTGLVEVSCKITLSDQNQLILDYLARPHEDTIINLTHHVYLNLDGHRSDSIKNHVFQVFADHYTPVYPDGIPTGEIRPVQNTVFDFRSPKPIDLSLFEANNELSTRRGYDHNFCLNGEKEFKVAASVYSKETGIKLTCYTDQPGLQLYTGNFIAPNTPGKDGGLYNPYSGFCLETQNYPDAINNPLFPSPIYRKGEKYRSRTVYEFGIR